MTEKNIGGNNIDDNEIDLAHDQMANDGGLHFFQYLSWKSLIDIFRKDRAIQSEDSPDSDVHRERNYDNTYIKPEK